MSCVRGLLKIMSNISNKKNDTIWYSLLRKSSLISKSKNFKIGGFERAERFCFLFFLNSRFVWRCTGQTTICLLQMAVRFFSVKLPAKHPWGQQQRLLSINRVDLTRIGLLMRWICGPTGRMSGSQLQIVFYTFKKPERDGQTLFWFKKDSCKHIDS